MVALAAALVAQSSTQPGTQGQPAQAVQPVSVQTVTTLPAQRVRITVRAIAASSPGPDGTSREDPKLEPISQNLRAFGDQFRFKSYQLVQEETFDLDLKSPAQMELPGSRSLQLTPRQLSAEGNIKVHLELLGEHPAHSRKLHTDYSIHRGGTIFVGGLKLDPHDPQSATLLIAITQAVEK